MSGKRMWWNDAVKRYWCGMCVGLNVVYWRSGVGSAQAANTSAVLKRLFFQRGPVIWKVGLNVALGLDVADVCCQFGKFH